MTNNECRDVNNEKVRLFWRLLRLLVWVLEVDSDDDDDGDDVVVVEWWSGFALQIHCWDECKCNSNWCWCWSVMVYGLSLILVVWM